MTSVTKTDQAKLPQQLQATNSVERNPSWQDNSHSTSQEIPSLSWNPKVHYRVYNSLPLVPILNKLDQFKFSSAP
jgi:hypothetical protein